MENTVVYAYVVADLLHTGHILYLENAKALGDKLIVGVLTDEATMEKKLKPILSFSERMRLIKALKCVDCVVAQTEYSPERNIKTINPDIIVESESHEVNTDKRIIIFPYYPEQSSTKIKEKLKK